MRRLYIGGLSHSITQKDLKDRFGKFGEVEDVELRTRKDEEGIPYKTFGYININISDTDLKKCLTVLNKSKWKGGTLQIETAKESFLHRLAEERQMAAKQHLQMPGAEDKRQKMLDSLCRAGVDNFTMKAAVPGTEVPGHKDWVVSKFGRVLPVLQLRFQKGSRARTMKYDPSKYSHNIRMLDQSTADQPTPVTQLTWEVQGGDDDISKKRRGEFPPFEPLRPKKSRTDMDNSHNAMGKSRFKQTADSVHHIEAHQLTNGYKQPTNHRRAQRLGPVTDSDVDSDEEIRRMMEAQDDSHVTLQQEVDEDNLEVVGLDYLVKSGGPDDEEENDYDSADTDELLASRKSPAQERPTLSTAECFSRKNTDRKRKAKKKGNTGEEEEDAADGKDHLTSRKPCSTQQRGDSDKDSKRKKMAALPVVKPPLSESDSDDEDEEDLGSADYTSDSDYEAMFSYATHLEISLTDLQRLAEESPQTSKTTAPSIRCASSEQESSITFGPAERHAPKKGIMPDEILAALMEEDSSEDEQKKKKRKAVMSTPLPAFPGTQALNEASKTEECQRSQKGEEEEELGELKKQKVASEDPQLNQRLGRKCESIQKHTETVMKTSESSEEEEEDEEEEEKEKEDKASQRVSKVVPTKAAVNSEKTVTGFSSSSDSEEEEEEMKVSQTILTPKVVAVTTPSSYSSSTEEDKAEQELISTKDAVKVALAPAPHSEEEEEKQAPPRVPLGPEEEEERQKKANMRRLAAVQQRQKEAAEHKKLIQGALARLDASTGRAGNHIVFGSDDDGDDEDRQQTSPKVTVSTKSLFEDSQPQEEATANKKNKVKEKVHLKPSAPQLFSGSEDEEDGYEEEDGSSFDIRPQFEGRAGLKLMELQSRFGTDERFRMDSRFLEEDKDKEEESERKKSVTEEDEALEDERKKNLSILQSVLGSSQQTSSNKTASKAKTFRDVSVLHYDPSREEHAAFETKTSETKESKSARRKKREEALKLPEVSKEIYYDVSGDLKAVFGQTKDDDAGGEEKTSWDLQEEEEGEEEGRTEEQPTPLSSLLSSDPSTEREKLSGFKFSFFGDDTDTGSRETEYKVESIQAPKLSWQQDLRFHDSSSDEEEEQEKAENQSSVTATTREVMTPSQTDRFFFYTEDSRLTDGPRLFCRSSQLEEQREQWEERRGLLRQEYRKKHKDARRKLKSSHKS